MTRRTPPPVLLVDAPAERALLGCLMHEPKRLGDTRLRRALFAVPPHARIFELLRAAYAEGRLGGDLLTASAALEVDASLERPRTLAAEAYLAAEEILPEPLLAHVVYLARRRQTRALAVGLQAIAEHPVAGDDREALGTIAARTAELAEPPGDTRAWQTVADVPALRVAWLWGSRIPLGKITLLEGDPGLGKSTVSLDVAARVSRGAPLEGDREAWDPAGVVLVGAEDGIADTLRPRLEAAGADLARIVAFRLERLPTLPADLAPTGPIRAAIRAVEAALLIFDPLMAFLAAGVDSYRDQDVRLVLRELAGLAVETGVAVLIIRHLNKQSGGKALYRGGGSIGITGAARSELLVAADPDNADERILCAVKANLCAEPPSLRFALDATADSVRVRWLGPSTRRADELVRDGDATSAEIAEAITVLGTLLANGPVAAERCERERKSLGITEWAWRQARRRLKVETRKESFSGGWVWSLPDPSTKH